MTDHPRPARLRDVILAHPRTAGHYTSEQVQTAIYVCKVLRADVDVATAPLLWQTFNVLIELLELEVQELADGAA